MTSETTYQYPAVTVDVLIFTIRNEALQVLLVKRGIEPFKGKWAIPGGFIREGEDLEVAARRELLEEAGVKDVFLEQLYTFGDPKRDPRGRVITVAYYALLASDALIPRASTDVTEAEWFTIDRLPRLAFDHQVIVKVGLERIRSKLRYSNIAYALLPEVFRLSELQRVYEVILGRSIDKRNFRKWVRNEGLIKSTGKIDRSGAHRPAELYQFVAAKLIHFG